MTSLRSRVVEAGAATVWNELPRYELSYPECERTARVVLDAMLDCLTENADEWDLEMAEWLLSELREDR